MVPLLNPPVREPFQYDKLPDTILNLDVISSEPLVYKTSLLGTVKKTTLGPTETKNGILLYFF